MRKKKSNLRKIVVEKQTYYWVVGTDDETKWLQIWLNKKVIYKKEIKSTMIVTPNYVRRMILGEEP